MARRTTTADLDTLSTRRPLAVRTSPLESNWRETVRGVCIIKLTIIPSARLTDSLAQTDGRILVFIGSRL